MPQRRPPVNPLRDYKERHRLSVADLAARLGVTPDAVHRLLRYNRRPSYEVAETIAQLLGCSTGNVLADYHKRVPKESL